MRLEALLEAAISILKLLATYRVINDEDERLQLLARHRGSSSELEELNEGARNIRELFVEDNAAGLAQCGPERRTLAIKAHTLFRQLSRRFAQYLVILSGVDDAGVRDRVPPKSAKTALSSASVTIAEMFDAIGYGGNPTGLNMAAFNQADLAMLAEHFIAQPYSEFAGMDPSAVAGWIVGDNLTDHCVDQTGRALSWALATIEALIKNLLNVDEAHQFEGALPEANAGVEELQAWLLVPEQWNAGLIALSQTSEVRGQKDLAARFRALAVEGD